MRLSWPTCFRVPPSEYPRTPGPEIGHQEQVTENTQGRPLLLIGASELIRGVSGVVERKSGEGGLCHRAEPVSSCRESRQRGLVHREDLESMISLLQSFC